MRRTVKLSEGHLRRIIRSILNEGVDESSSIVAQAIDNTDPAYLARTLEMRNPSGTMKAGSTFKQPQTPESLKSANWKPLNHPNISSPKIGFTGDIPGTLGVISIDELPDQMPVRFQLIHAGTGGDSGKGMEVAAAFNPSDADVSETTIILVPDRNDPKKHVVVTFFPGDPTPPFSEDITIDMVKEKFPDMIGTVADAKELGFKFVKRIEKLTENNLKRIIKKVIKESFDSNINKR